MRAASRVREGRQASETKPGQPRPCSRDGGRASAVFLFPRACGRLARPAVHSTQRAAAVLSLAREVRGERREEERLRTAALCFATQCCFRSLSFLLSSLYFFLWRDFHA